MKEILSKAMDQGGRLRVRSALNPALWMCAIVSLPIFLSFTFMTDPPIALQVAGLIPIVIASIGFLVLLAIDRDKLQSEEFQIRKKSLEIIEQSDGLKITDMSDLNLVSNPTSEDGS